MTLLSYQGKPLDFFEQPVGDEHLRGCCNELIRTGASGTCAVAWKRLHARGRTLGRRAPDEYQELVNRADWEWND